MTLLTRAMHRVMACLLALALAMPRGAWPSRRT